MKHDLANVLRDFADAVRSKTAANAAGQPEAQLSGPVSTLIDDVGKCMKRKIVAKAESATDDRLGIPDFGVVVDNALSGYLELKAPGHGADTSRYKGRDREQWNRFKAQPNIIYTDGNEWCLYQNGEPAERLLRFSKDISKHGAKGVSDADVAHFGAIVTKMLAWGPQFPEDPRDQATMLAPLCGLLRADVADAVRDPASPINKIAKDWRQLLFPDADDDRFADSYAQTVTFALLLARSESADVSDLGKAIAKLDAEHALLSRALQVLTDTKARAEIRTSLAVLQRVINAFPKDAMTHDPAKGEDPWLYFYEHFLAAYDQKLRKDYGVYYTPVQVVKCQVALVDHLLRNRLGKAGGFAHKDVITLDPAVGTGTYLLGVIDHALASVKTSQGTGAVAAKATALAGNLYGFELMTGPYAVSELRLTRDLKGRGAKLPRDGIGVYLADTLESPFGVPPNLPQFFQPIAEQHERALHVKDKKAVIVCLGNPPYDRHDAVQYVGDQVAISDRARTGGWVRWGDSGDPAKAILSAFIDPAKAAGHGGDLKNLYNLYVYFWRWAMWKVFQHTSGKAGDNAGIVSFITASSYIRGDAFVGMREMLRRACDEVWIIDLGGEGRGTRQDENVFNIQTPVAICIALREGQKKKDTPAIVHYASMVGSREKKYAELAKVSGLSDLKWKTCPTAWHAPLRPAGTGPYFKWPLLTDLMPWQSGGAQLKRKWPIAPDTGTLHRRWKALLRSSERAKCFVETRDRKVAGTYPVLPGVNAGAGASKPIATLTTRGEPPPVCMYGYRSFDRQYVFADNRIGDYMRPSLWHSHSDDRQLYFCSIFTKVLGDGPALTATAHIPDLDFFSNRGAKDVAPLYRDAGAKTPNVVPGLLAQWGKRLKRAITPESFAAYVYAVLANPGFVAQYWDELEDCQLRVPVTLDAKLYHGAVELGSRLLFLHTYGERFRPKGKRGADIPPGSARVKEAISDAPEDYPEEFSYDDAKKVLCIGTGVIIKVSPAVWSYEVSGLQVVRSWLGYRMKERKGRKSSPLDDIHPERWTSEFTDELLRLLWILEATIDMHDELDTLLAKIVAGPLLLASDMPKVPAAMRKPPRASDQGGLFGDDDDSDDEGDDAD